MSHYRINVFWKFFPTGWEKISSGSDIHELTAYSDKLICEVTEKTAFKIGVQFSKIYAVPIILEYGGDNADMKTEFSVFYRGEKTGSITFEPILPLEEDVPPELGWDESPHFQRLVERLIAEKCDGYTKRTGWEPIPFSIVNTE